MSLTRAFCVTLMTARLFFSLPWRFLMFAVIVASLTRSASYWFDVISLVFSSLERRLVRSSIMAWVWVMLAAWAATGVTINVPTQIARTTRGVDRVVPRRRTRIIKPA